MARPDPILATMAAQERHQEALLTRRNVIGVATGYAVRNGRLTSQLAIQVLVQKKEPSERLAVADLIARELPGPEGKAYPTDVIEISIPEAQQDTTRYRPVPAGCSIGPESRVSAGTLGGWACDNTDDTTILLSNNHVISNLDTMPALRRIVQPGRFDGGVLPGDVIGELKRHIVLNTVPNGPGANPPNSVVDAAIGTITVQRDSNVRQINVPVIFEVQAPALNMNVQKRGRTTQLTTNGRISSINATILVTYQNQTRLGRVQNSFIISSTNGNVFSAAGDSGSLILNQAVGSVNGTRPVVGLLFAGGTDGAGAPITIANDINAVFGALNLATICTCVVRALIRASVARDQLDERTLQVSKRKERQLRYLQEQMRSSRGLASIVESVISTEAARLGKLLADDEEAFKAASRALEPLLSAATNQDLLATRLDKGTLEALLRFGAIVGRKSRDLKPIADLGIGLVKELEGKTVATVLRAADPGFAKALTRGARTRRKPRR
jgi:hypothetical protein